MSETPAVAAAEHLLRAPDGRTLQAWATRTPGGRHPQTILWHHGSPQTGAPLAPVADAAAARGLRLVTYARPGYGRSTAQEGRDVASAAADVAAIADALGLDRFAVLGASGGAPHALACAALLPDRVTAAASFAGLAPYTGDPAWFQGMAAPGGLRAAIDGPEARALFAAIDEFEPRTFTARDWDVLRGPWAALGRDALAAETAGPGGLVADDVAFVQPWGADLGAVHAPVLLVQGGEDRVVPATHATWLLEQIPSAELWLRPSEGHISVLTALAVALDWIRAAG